MLAVVQLREKNLAAEVPTVRAVGGGITSSPVGPPLRFKMADQGASDGSAPLIIPGSVQRSYEVWLRLAFGIVGPNVSLTSPIFYTDGSSGFGPGVTLYARTTNPGSYSTPGTPANDSAGTNAFTYTSTSPKALDVANTGPFSGTNSDFGDYLVLWLTITSAAKSQGKPAEFTLPLESLCFTWNET